MIKIRKLTPQSDPAEAFLYSAWIRSYVAAAQGGDDQDPPQELTHYLVRANHIGAMSAMRMYIRDLIERPDVTVYVAAAEDDPQLLLGFLCCDASAVHYVYIKKRVRRQGLATRLFQQAEQDNGPIERTTTVTWPWTLEWIANNGITYCPSLINVQAQQTEPAPATGTRRRDPALAFPAEPEPY